jgi:hypothetical protein
VSFSSRFDWPSLIAEVNGRVAIYNEGFPALLDQAVAGLSARARFWFDQSEAQSVLVTFAGAWKSLGVDRVGERRFRYFYRGVPDTGEVFTFRVVELAPDAIVVLDVATRPGAG